ncbi:unnamed protein product [Clonostachys byssicola]|uniref:Fungal N-terminal domain-containing protein n=1 Tax=Clonostachys byssicola TaxID=160290 RepID=A0A9N9UKN7_9HYPO|nr:unnamed protein product [Clonostachys byssicola]
MSGTIFGSLISESIELIHTIRKALDRVKMAKKTCLDIQTQIDSTSATLDAINREPILQVDKIKQPMENILIIEKELQAALDEREEDAKRHKIQQFGKSLISGDEMDKQVNDILNRLAHARGELHACITTIHIGLTDSLDSGFRVARSDLQRINDTVRELCGQQLVLAERLEPREQNLTQDDETGQSLLASLVRRLAGQDSAGGTHIEGSNRLDWHKNKAGKDASMLVGNSGYEIAEHKNLGPVRANMRDNTFGKGLRLHVGHIKSGPDFFKRR